MTVTIVYGPAGCGKSTHAADIKRILVADLIVEEDQKFTEDRWVRLKANHKHIALLCVNPERLPRFQRLGTKLRHYDTFNFTPRAIEEVGHD